jgi:hypothetical protein
MKKKEMKILKDFLLTKQVLDAFDKESDIESFALENDYPMNFSVHEQIRIMYHSIPNLFLYSLIRQIVQFSDEHENLDEMTFEFE